MSAHPFDVDTAVDPDENGSAAVTLTGRWDRLGGGPLGSYSLVVMLRALQASMSFPDPLVATAFFHRPARHGAAVVHTEVIRAGRRTATSEARLVQNGTEMIRVLASFTDLDGASGPTLLLNRPPALPDPDDCVDPFTDSKWTGVSSLATQIDYRFAATPGWPRGSPSGHPALECWIRFKEPRENDLLALAFFVDAVAPAVMEIGARGSSTIELTVHLRARPQPGWLACRISTRHVIDGIHEEDFEIWDAAGTLVAQSRQLALIP